MHSAEQRLYQIPESAPQLSPNTFKNPMSQSVRELSADIERHTRSSANSVPNSPIYETPSKNEAPTARFGADDTARIQTNRELFVEQYDSHEEIVGLDSGMIETPSASTSRYPERQPETENVTSSASDVLPSHSPQPGFLFLESKESFSVTSSL